MKNSSHVRLPCKSLNLMILGHPRKKSQNYGKPYTIFQFVGQFFFQNDVFNFQEVFSELEVRV
jgi:hypothetical protein